MGKQMNLLLVETKLPIKLHPALRDRELVRQEDTRLTGGEYGVKDRGLCNIVQRLRGKQYGRVVFTQRLKPFLDFLRKHRVLKEDPALIKDDERRLLIFLLRAFHDVLDAMEDIHECRTDDTARVHQTRSSASL